MKIEELSIGDWVFNKHHARPIRITPFDFFTHRHDKEGNQYISDCFMLTTGRDLEPIPITPEILEKNGFRFDGMGKWKCVIKKTLEEIEVCPVQPDNEWWDVFSTGIRTYSIIGDVAIDGVRQIYVHELQHALRLCGIEKEIVL